MATHASPLTLPSPQRREGCREDQKKSSAVRAETPASGDEARAEQGEGAMDAGTSCEDARQRRYSWGTVMMTWVSPEVFRKFLKRTTVAMMVGWFASSVLKPPRAVMVPSKPVSMEWRRKPTGP